MAKSTFPISQLLRPKQFDSDDKRCSLALGELFINAKTYGAQKIFAADAKIKGSRRVLVSHDGEPFKDLADILACLHTSTSGGVKGYQGQGMKGGALMTVEKEEDMELVVWCRCADGTVSAGRLRLVNGNDGEIRDVSDEWREAIPKVLGDNYADATVVYVLRQTLKPQNSLVSEKVMMMSSLLCPFVSDAAKVRYITTTNVGDTGMLHKSFTEFTTKGGQLHRMGGSDSFFKSHSFYRETVTLSRRLLSINSEKVLEVSGRVEFIWFSGLIDNISLRMVRTNPDDRNTRTGYGTADSDIFIPSERALLYFPGFSADTDKAIERVQKNPIFSQVNVNTMLGNLGIYFPSGRKVFQDWVMYPDIDPDSDFKRKPFPMVRVFIDCIHSEKTLGNGGVVVSTRHPEGVGALLCVGGIDEFGYTYKERLCQKIMEEMVLATAEDRALMRRLKDKVAEIVPLEQHGEDLALDMEIGPTDSPESLVVYNASNEAVQKVAPGSAMYGCKLMLATSKKPVTGDVVSLSDGITIFRSSPGVYDIHVCPLMRKQPDGTRVTITEAEWSWNGDCIPKRKPRVQAEGVSRYLALKVDLPGKRYNTPHGVRVSHGSNPNPLADGTLGYPYVDMDDPGPVVMFSRTQPLKMNKPNKYVQIIRDPRIQDHPALYTRVRKLWKNMQLEADYLRDMASNWNFDGFTGERKKELQETYGDVENFFVNEVIRRMFDSESVQKLLNDIQQTLEPHEPLALDTGDDDLKIA